jgi:hypothetical protein
MEAVQLNNIFKRLTTGERAATGCVFAIIQLFYKPFVIQNMWNWFLTGAIHGEDISYFHVFGITILVGLLTNRGEKGEELKRWDLLQSYVAAMVPPESKITIDSERKTLEDSIWYSNADSFIDLGGSTIFLVIGWGIHSFLM